jgi:hypothetical protein
MGFASKALNAEGAEGAEALDHIYMNAKDAEKKEHELR